MDHFSLGQPEVSDLVGALLHEDVGGLEVSVDDVELAEIAEALTDLDSPRST